MAEKLEVEVTVTEKTGPGLNQAKANLSGLDKVVKGMKGSLTELSSGLILAEKGFKFVADVVNETVGETVSYAKQVRDLSRVLGTNSQETSRLIQLADDYKIEVGTLETAMKLALKNGFEPTTENLAVLADRYVALESPTERAAMLSEIFGKNWAALTPLLEQGGDAIREQSAAISESLILTEQQVQAAREWEIQEDSLNDTIQGLKYTIGNALIPTMASGGRVINDWVNLNLKLEEAVRDGNITHLEALAIRERVRFTSLTSAEALAELIEKEQGATEASIDLRDGHDLLTQAQERNKAITEELTEAEARQEEQVAALTDGIVGASDVTADFSRELIFNRAAADLDAEAALSLGRQLGIVDEKAVQAIQGLEALRNRYDTNRDGAISAAEGAQEYADAVADLYRRINALQDKNVTVTVTTRHITHGGPGSGVTGRQHGGQVMANQVYMVGERGPELFVSDMPGRIIPNQAVQNTTNFYLNANYPHQRPEDLQADIRHLEMLYR